MQWTGCHGKERHGGDRGCGGCNGHCALARRDMEVTEVMEDTMDRVSWRGDMEVTEVVEDAMDRVSWRGETWR